MSVLVNALPEFLGSLTATLTVAVVRWSARALCTRASGARQPRETEEV